MNLTSPPQLVAGRFLHFFRYAASFCADASGHEHPPPPPSAFILKPLNPSLEEGRIQTLLSSPIPPSRLLQLLRSTLDSSTTLTPVSASLLVRSFVSLNSPSDALLAFHSLHSSLRCTNLCNHLLPSLLRSSSSDHGAQALSLIHQMLSSSSHCRPNSLTCSILFTALSRSSHPTSDEALDLVVQMTGSGVFPTDMYQFTKIIVGLCRAGRTPRAWDFIYAIKNRGGRVEVPVWNALLTGLSKDRDASRLELVFSEMETAGATNAVTYGIVINHLCKSRCIDAALQVFDKMTVKDSAVRPDTVIFNSIIDGLCKVGRAPEGLDLLNRMRSHSCNPNTITFNALIDGLCKAGDIDAAFELNARMAEEGIPPNIVTLNTLISGMCHNGMVSGALRFFHEKKAKWTDAAKGNSITYSTLIGAFLHANNVGKAMELFDEMIRDGHSPDAVTYFTLISGFSMAGRIDDASLIASMMRRDGFCLDTKSYNILIAGFSKKKRFDRALKVFEEMHEARIKPDVVTYNTLIDACCKAGDFSMAQNLLIQMAEDNCKPSLVSYGTLIHGFFKNGDNDGAVKIFESMEGSNVLPNTAIYNILVDSFCKDGLIDTAISYLDQMRSNGVSPNAVTYNAIMKGLCEKNMFGKAFELMNQMKEVGCNPDLTTMDILAGWLPAIGETERFKWFMAGNETVFS